jgi:PleD family two-component response regulator
VGTRESGAAALPAADLVPRPAPADRLFAALERAGVPRGKGGTVLVVDEALPVLESTGRALTILGYRPRVEPDGDAALRSCAESPPAAVVLSPFLNGMDGFAFLVHLRRLPGLARVPVVLTVPREIERERWAALLPSADAAARERLWPKMLRPLLTREG